MRRKVNVGILVLLAAFSGVANANVIQFFFGS